MSELNNVAQSVSSLVSDTEGAINQLQTYSKQINGMIVLLNTVLNQTNQREYRDLINQLTISQKKVELALNNLRGVSKYGNDWIRAHFLTGGGSSGLPNSFTNDSTAGEPNTHDSFNANNGNAPKTEECSSETDKTKRLSKEEAQERYKNGLNSIEEALEIHKEALIARGVPDGEWLRKTLAVERSLMIQQLANDIEVARGQAEPQKIYDVLESGEDGSFKFYDKLAQSYFSEKSATGACIDWKTQPELNRANITLNLNKTNPNYTPLTEWSVNCQRCVPTYEMRRRGYDVTAYPKNDPNDYICRHPFDVWKNPDILHTDGTGQERIVEKMIEWGDGSRAQVVVKWHGVPEGHTFIAENVHGKIRFIDPQNGDEDVSRYFKTVEVDQTQFCRIDNLIPSDLILQCSKEV